MTKRTAYKKVKQRKQQVRKARFKGLLSAIRDSITNIAHKRAEGRGEGSTHPDWTILNIVAGLCVFGWIMIYSGSFYVASQRADTLFYQYNPYHFFILQGIWLLVASVVGYIVYKFPLEAIKKLSPLGLIVIGILLIVVLILPTEINGAKQWILIGPFSLQPSEFAKPLLIIYLAVVLSNFSKKKITDVKSYIQESVLPFALIALPIVALILLGRDLATAGLVGVVALTIYFFSQNTSLHNLATIGLVVVALLAGIGFTFSEGYRQNRVNTYIGFLSTGEVADPTNTGYQLRQVLIAVGSGGVNGYGFGQSKQKYNYLQETAFNDTIFAVVAEEFGFIGSIIVIFAYVILIFRSLKIAQRAPNKFQQLTVIGISSWLFFQSAIHLGVNVGLIPLTGMTMPFLSYGGSSLIATLIGIGLLLNISKQVKID